MSIADTAHDLTPEGFVDLFDIVLAEEAGSIHVTSQVGYTFNGIVYVEHPCHLTSVGQQADSEVTRPRFTVANPEGVFTAAVNQRLLENGYILRHRALLSEVPLGIGLTRKFRIGRVANVSRVSITMELRGALDAGNFKFPPRAFNPPEFPFVRLR